MPSCLPYSLMSAGAVLYNCVDQLPSYGPIFLTDNIQWTMYVDATATSIVSSAASSSSASSSYASLQYASSSSITTSNSTHGKHHFSKGEIAGIALGAFFLGIPAACAALYALFFVVFGMIYVLIVIVDFILVCVFGPAPKTQPSPRQPPPHQRSTSLPQRRSPPSMSPLPPPPPYPMPSPLPEMSQHSTGPAPAHEILRTTPAVVPRPEAPQDLPSDYDTDLWGSECTRCEPPVRVVRERTADNPDCRMLRVTCESQ